MSKYNKYTKGALLAAVLVCAVCLGAVVRFRAAAVTPEESPVPEPAALTPAPTPDPTPEPTPTPTPEPTPIPLLPVELAEYRAPGECFGPTEQYGEIFKVEYETHDYVRDPSVTVKKEMGVYLPYGYDETKEYDVVFMFHVKGCDESFWLHYDMEYQTDGENRMVNIPNMLDNMISRGRCKPVIVFSPDLYVDDTVRSTHDGNYTYPQFRREFAEDIMPYVVENFATYAEGSDRESLREAREHFGVIGASFGAYMVYNAVLQESFDLVANYALTGGGYVDRWTLANCRAALGAEEMPVSCLYFGAGQWESFGEPQGAYYDLMQDTEMFSEGNLFFTLFPDSGHDSGTWITTAYNAFQLFFRNE